MRKPRVPPLTREQLAKLVRHCHICKEDHPPMTTCRGGWCDWEPLPEEPPLEFGVPSTVVDPKR